MPYGGEDMRHMLAIALVATLTICSAVAQEEGQREPQMATKTVPAMYVAYVTQTTSLDQMAQNIRKALQELWPACTDNGYHPIGPAIVTANLNNPPGAAQKISWEMWVPITDQPTEADLADDAVVLVKRIPPRPVAYTYHIGALDDMQGAFMGLATWAMSQGLEIVGRGLATMFRFPGTEDLNLVVECQLEVTKLPD